MLIWVVYESKLGNTAALAQLIAGELAREHRVRLMPAEEAGVPHGVDLLIIGCPHHRHHQPDALLAWAFKLPPRVLHGIRLGIFEIRYRRHFFWQGESAAALVWRRLLGLGGKPVSRPVSFYLHHRSRQISEAEMGRGAAWARSLARKAQEGVPKGPFIHAGDHLLN
ncbi:MAG TPA: hypothetical protein PLG50_03800 [bacterium]|nr:hypothetical protein [bacterium]HQG44760.1 hypothetical protein [bacterium]HQI48180.1 hypothetical protein [bacterium]HQJ64559.1 hypothetical protein [bacterium]